MLLVTGVALVISVTLASMTIRSVLATLGAEPDEVAEAIGVWPLVSWGSA